MSSYENGRFSADQALIHHSANQSISALTWTALSFNTDTYDPWGLHDTATNNSRMTMRRLGVSALGFAISWEANTTGLRAARLVVNGSAVWFVAGLSAVTYAGSQTPVWSPNVPLALDIGDYVEVEVLQDTTGGGALNVLTGTNTPRMWCIGPYPPAVSP